MTFTVSVYDDTVRTSSFSWTGGCRIHWLLLNTETKRQTKLLRAVQYTVTGANRPTMCLEMALIIFLLTFLFSFIRNLTADKFYLQV